MAAAGGLRAGAVMLAPPDGNQLRAAADGLDDVRRPGDPADDGLFVTDILTASHEQLRIRLILGRNGPTLRMQRWSQNRHGTWWPVPNGQLFFSPQVVGPFARAVAQALDMMRDMMAADRPGSPVEPTAGGAERAEEHTP